jgi:diadenosine tetraphosphate (Ap4A) HIT family hydrolase
MSQGFHFKTVCKMDDALMISNRDKPDFRLDERLQNDCHVLGQLNFCQLLLMDNTAVPWFILVPATGETEICDLAAAEQALLWGEVNTVAEFIRSNYSIDKLNIGAIGNVVSQLHVHVIGRRTDDYCWPDVVWGRKSESAYTDDEVAVVKQNMEVQLIGASE